MNAYFGGVILVVIILTISELSIRKFGNSILAVFATAFFAPIAFVLLDYIVNSNIDKFLPIALIVGSLVSFGISGAYVTIRFFVNKSMVFERIRFRFEGIK